MIHTCIDRFLPGRTPLEQDQSAPDEIKRGAAERDKLWRPLGRTLRIRFLDGNLAVQKKVIKFAQEWTQYANLNFAFGEDPTAEIRISFRQPGSWSFIGTDALDPAIAPDQPTMNFGWLTRGTPNDEVRRVVLHEFGHALGLIHEHQNPVAAIPWNRVAVYDYYQGPPNDWSREAVDANLFALYDAQRTQFTTFDPASIMLYPVPAELTVGGFAVGWNQTLSTTDIAFIRSCYPFEVQPTTSEVNRESILLNEPTHDSANQQQRYFALA